MSAPEVSTRGFRFGCLGDPLEAHSGGGHASRRHPAPASRPYRRLFSGLRRRVRRPDTLATATSETKQRVRGARARKSTGTLSLDAADRRRAATVRCVTWIEFKLWRAGLYRG